MHNIFPVNKHKFASKVQRVGESSPNNVVSNTASFFFFFLR